MYCRECGVQVDTRNRFCASCGAAIDMQSQEMHGYNPKKNNNKKTGIIISVAVLLLISFAAFLLFAPIFNSAEQPLSVWEMLDLGEKHLRDLEYEQALEQFLGVIEIEPRNPRGYTGAAEAYIGLGRENDAMAILEVGLNVIGESASIQRMLDDLVDGDYHSGIIASPPVPTPEPTPAPLPTPPFLRNDVFAAYHELLLSLISEFGVGNNVTIEHAPYFEGVIYAELIDFDNDGIPELLVIRGEESFPASAVCLVYRYTTGGVELLGSYGLYLNHAWVSIVESRNGTSYLCYSGGDSFGVDDTYYTIVDGFWIEVLNRAFYIEEIYGDNWEWLRDEHEWFVNGHSATEQEYNDALESNIGNADIRFINFFDDIFHTVNEVLTTLENES
jgi:hypothetical protein